MGYRLTPIGSEIVRKGGHDLATDDDMLLLEIQKRAPGLSITDYRKVFVDLRLNYGEEALYAIRSGHVQFEAVPAGTRPEGDEHGRDR